MHKHLYFVVFTSGMTSLALEMAGSRLLGNYFGSSNMVWASIIGLILIYLAVGYFVGGRWADRSPHFSTLYTILAWAGFSGGIIPLVARPLLRSVDTAFNQLQVGALAGSFISVLVLFLVPTILLGTASPFAIRLAVVDREHSGVTAGEIYAVSTLGSFVGTFLPVLVLTPLLGIFRSFIIIGGILVLVALSGLWQTTGARAVFKLSWMPLILLALGIVGQPGFDKSTPGLIFETESGYNYIQVVEENGYHLLKLNEGQGVHSVYHPDVLNYQGPWEQVLVAPFFNAAPVRPADVRSMAIIGLAAGTTARQASIVFPDIQIDGYEIDPKIVTAGRDYFGMTMPNLDVFVVDGREGLEQSQKTYQVISVDAYRPPYIPPHMVTREFFALVRSHLTADGVMVINIGRGPNDRRLINALATTILTDFPSVHVMDIPDTYNSILFATVQPTQATNLLENYAGLIQPGSGAHPLLVETMAVTLTNLQPAPEQTLVFTDDKAPIEWMTNNLILSFLFSPSVEAVQ
ncbi:MAG TPA: fused MFS/spermidine synthase [Anaerolineaceae bacterium]